MVGPKRQRRWINSSLLVLSMITSDNCSYEIKRRFCLGQGAFNGFHAVGQRKTSAHKTNYKSRIHVSLVCRPTPAKLECYTKGMHKTWIQYILHKRDAENLNATQGGCRKLEHYRRGVHRTWILHKRCTKPEHYKRGMHKTTAIDVFDMKC